MAVCLDTLKIPISIKARLCCQMVRSFHKKIGLQSRAHLSLITLNFLSFSSSCPYQMKQQNFSLACQGQPGKVQGASGSLSRYFSPYAVVFVHHVERDTRRTGGNNGGIGAGRKATRTQHYSSAPHNSPHTGHCVLWLWSVVLYYIILLLYIICSYRALYTLQCIYNTA